MDCPLSPIPSQGKGDKENPPILVFHSHPLQTVKEEKKAGKFR
jgi:hypothetical protein